MGTYDDCNHYLYIIATLENTIVLIKEIEEILPGFPLK